MCETIIFLGKEMTFLPFTLSFITISIIIYIISRIIIDFLPEKTKKEKKENDI